MNKIALITDTTCDLSQDIINEYNINLLPFRIIYKDKEYKDKFEISAEEVYKRLETEIPTSSMPAMEDMEALYEKLESEGYTHAIVITLSSGLSGIFNGIKVVSENHPNIVTYVCDSKSISLGEGMLAAECGKLIKNGKTFEEIVNILPSIKSKMHLYFVVGTLEYLKKGGRIGKVAGTIAELLNIKPIVSLDENDGKYFTYDKVRGRKQSLNRLVNIAEEFLSKTKCKIYLMHGDAYEDAKKVYEALSKLPNITSISLGGYISPVSGVHSGPGLVGMLCIEDE